MFSFPVLPIPPHFRRRYQIARMVLYSVVIISITLFALRTLFPTFVFSFNFRTPNSSNNTLLDPHSKNNTPRMNGKIGDQDTLILTAGGTREFSNAGIDVTLEEKTTFDLKVSLRRSYLSFLLPTGPPIDSFPRESLYRIDGIYYALREGILYPFVSDNAYVSRFPDTFALPGDKALLTMYPVSENWIGYRVGAMVAFADGVFLITSETDMRPVGNAETFLALGYRFEDVRPVSEEEIGIYKRGRIIRLGTQHPDGTLLLDRDTDTYYLVEGSFKRPVTDVNYRNFVMAQQAPIIVSSESSKLRVNCDLKPGFLGQTFSCQTPLAMLQSGLGNDFEITLDNSGTGIDLRTLQVSFETEKSKKNMLLVLSKIKQLLLVRFGANP